MGNRQEKMASSPGEPSLEEIPEQARTLLDQPDYPNEVQAAGITRKQWETALWNYDRNPRNSNLYDALVEVAGRSKADAWVRANDPAKATVSDDANLARAIASETRAPLAERQALGAKLREDSQRASKPKQEAAKEVDPVELMKSTFVDGEPFHKDQAA